MTMDVYGEGPHLDEIRAVAADAPVRFHGFIAGRDDLSRRIAAADVSLSVCPGETFGLAVLEALASGTPVVTADRGGARELVDHASGAWGAPTPGASRTRSSAWCCGPRRSAGPRREHEPRSSPGHGRSSGCWPSTTTPRRSSARPRSAVSSSSATRAATSITPKTITR